MDPEMMAAEQGMPPEMAGAPAMAPDDQLAPAGMEVPEGIDPGELAALLGEAIGQQRMQAHQAVDMEAEQAVQQVIAMVMQGAMGSQTLDGMAVAA